MESISIGIELQDGIKLPKRKMNQGYDVTGVTMNGTNYVELKHFSKSHNISDSSIRRLIKKVEHKDCNDYFIIINGKYYLCSSIMVLKNENFSRLNELHGNWEKFLRKEEWDYFGSIQFTWSLKSGTVRGRMEKLFYKLCQKYPNASVRLFFTTEANTTREGYHSHFVLWTDIKDKTAVKSYIENQLRGNGKTPSANTHILKYDPNDGGVGYILKELSLNPDGYDYVFKNKD